MSTDDFDPADPADAKPSGAKASSPRFKKAGAGTMNYLRDRAVASWNGTKVVLANLKNTEDYTAGSIKYVRDGIVLSVRRWVSAVGGKDDSQQEIDDQLAPVNVALKRTQEKYQGLLNKREETADKLNHTLTNTTLLKQREDFEAAWAKAGASGQVFNQENQTDVLAIAQAIGLPTPQSKELKKAVDDSGNKELKESYEQLHTSCTALVDLYANATNAAKAEERYKPIVEERYRHAKRQGELSTFERYRLETRKFFNKGYWLWIKFFFKWGPDKLIDAVNKIARGSIGLAAQTVGLKDQGYMEYDEVEKKYTYLTPLQTLGHGLVDLKTTADFYNSGAWRLTLGTFTNGPPKSLLVRLATTLVVLTMISAAPGFILANALGGALLWRAGARVFKSSHFSDKKETRIPRAVRWAGGIASVTGMLFMANAAYKADYSPRHVFNTAKDLTTLAANNVRALKESWYSDGETRDAEGKKIAYKITSPEIIKVDPALQTKEQAAASSAVKAKQEIFSRQIDAIRAAPDRNAAITALKGALETLETRDEVIAPTSNDTEASKAAFAKRDIASLFSAVKEAFGNPNISGTDIRSVTFKLCEKCEDVNRPAENKAYRPGVTANTLGR